jgi:hypothetical protein
MIKQINLVVDETVDSVEGYNNVDVRQLSSITNGYVESIIFTTIDKLDNNNRSTIFIESLKKLSHGGQLTVRFLNLILLSSRLKDNYIDGPKLANLIKGCQSFWTESDFLGVISAISGYKLIKIVNEDTNIIAVIEKNK